VPRKKKNIYNLPITGIADKGKAVGRAENGEVVFVTGDVVPGDVIDGLIVRKKKSMSEAVLLRHVSYSSDRVKPRCDHFDLCGGCKWQNLDYKAQLHQKHQVVKDVMRRIGKVSDDIVQPIIGCEEQFYYRNKLEYSFSSKRWMTAAEIESGEPIDNEGALGFHRQGSFDKIIAIDKCHLQLDLSNEIRNYVGAYARKHALSYYDVRSHQGLMRNMIVRNTTSGEWMLIMIFGHQDEAIMPLMDKIKTRFPQITSLHYIINTKFNDTIYDCDVHTLVGPGYIVEQLGDVKYKIGTKSFFQTNPRQAKRLFDVAVEYASLQSTDNVYDLYTGLGSIALYIANKVRLVTGIEEVKEAIDDAHDNMRYNNIDNATFYAGDVKDILTDDFIDKHGSPDIIITDPPRAGMHADVVQTLLTAGAPRIVYISCNPATQARDLALLSERYDVVRVQPVDMFPHTHHIESVALLHLRS
jgi:23S rRNA (uracil1939-C5)-methyltransferase